MTEAALVLCVCSIHALGPLKALILNDCTIWQTWSCEKLVDWRRDDLEGLQGVASSARLARKKQRLSTRPSDTLSYSIIFNLARALTRSMVSKPSLKNP